MKACIWAIAHMTTSAQGLKYLYSICEDVICNIIKLAKYSEVYSVRATAFFALGLIGSTFFGANLLRKLGKLFHNKIITYHDQLLCNLNNFMHKVGCVFSITEMKHGQ